MQIKYRYEIDGLRALAVIGVFFFHLKWPFMKGGWLGVDVFFVISGYLISSILIGEMKKTGSISFSNFYLRRTRRILPPLLVCLIGTFAISPLLYGTEFYAEYFYSFLAAIFSVSNVFFWLHTGYFGLDTNFVPLLHTWTLGVEEQFYLVIPAAIAAIAVIKPKMQTKAWVSIFFLVVGSFWICRYGNKFLSGNFRYYMLPSRFWELGIGTTVAFLLHWLQIKNKSNRICDEIISLAASAWICFAFTQYDVNSSFTEKSLFICIATALFIIFAKKQTLVGKIFTLKPIRFIGKISYSLYLWHWPLIVLGFLMELKYGAINPVIMNVSIIGTAFALSTLSWVYIETPFRKKTTWRECLRPLLSLVMVVALCVVAGDISLARMVSAPDKILLEEPVHKGTSFKDAKRGHYPAFGPNGKLELMVIGDSHSLALYSGLDAMADEFKVAGKIGARSRTFPILSICSVGHCDDPPFVATWLNYIKENNIKHILLVSRWNYIWDKEGLYLKTSKGVSKTNAKTVAGELEKQVRSLLDDGRVVWVLRQVPEFKTHPILAVSLMGADYTEDMTYRNNVDFAEEALQKISSPDLHFIDAAPYLVRDNKLSPVKKNTYLYRDLDHLSPQGAQVIKNAFRPLFETIIRDRQQNQGASTPLF